MDHNEFFLRLKSKYLPIRDEKRAYEYQRELAEYVTDHMLDDFSPVGTHVEKPEILRQYSLLSELERVSFDNKNPTWREGSVRAWQEEISRREMENKSHVIWLTEWMELLEDDVLRHHKLKDKLMEHSGGPAENRKEAQNIMSIFNGSIVRG